jgi:hypothetical protein
LQLSLKNKLHLTQLGLSRKYELILHIEERLIFGLEE